MNHLIEFEAWVNENRAGLAKSTVMTALKDYKAENEKEVVFKKMRRFTIEAEINYGDHPVSVLDIQPDPAGEWVRASEVRIMKNYYFEYWGSDRELKEAVIEASCEEHAVLKFEKEYPDKGYNEPYVWPAED